MNSTGYFIEPAQLRREYPSHVQWSGSNSILSPPECDALVQMAKSIGFSPAAIGNNEQFHVDPAYRQTDTATLEFSKETDWLYRRITERVASANRDYYGFDLCGLIEPFQVLRYTFNAESNEPPGHYDWHQDFGAGTMGRRKISFVANLSDPSEYDGCRLTLMSHRAEQLNYVGKGEGFIFPSWSPHCVSNITRGIRYSMVAWVHGAPFR